MVKPKKHLGQHFLRDKTTAGKIVEALEGGIDEAVILEIGPGTGVLTDSLLDKYRERLFLSEIDIESIEYLKERHQSLSDKIIEGDFTKQDWSAIFPNKNIHVIGNFPYNISSQLFFKMLTMREQVKEVVCMLQKEVAQRIVSPPGSKVYGILSVILQTFFDIEYLFTVKAGAFFPPPKVLSGVIRLKSKHEVNLPVPDRFYIEVVKSAFNNRRKTLRNALKNYNLEPILTEQELLLSKRAEQLSVDDFIFLAKLIYVNR